MRAGDSGNPPGQGAERRWRRAVLAAAALPPLALLAAEAYVFGDLGGFPLDDAWIHLDFARSLAGGDGLALRAGEPVAASTAPLWTALLALLVVLPGPLAAWAKLAGVVLQTATAGCAFRLGCRLGLTAPRAALAGLLVALTDWLVWSTASGMEVNLFTLLTLAGCLWHLGERAAPGRPPVSFLLFGLAALARPEGLLLPLLAAADRWLDAGAAPVAAVRRRVLVGLAAAALVVLPVGGAYLAISGSPLPTTLAAKSAAAPGWLPDARYLRGALGILFSSQPAPVLAAAGGALVLAGRLGSARGRGLLLPLWAFGMPVAASMLLAGPELNVGNFGRYLFPLLPPLILLGVLAAEAVDLRRLVAGRARPLVAALGLGAAALVVLPPAVNTVRAGALYLQARGNVEDADLAAARWLAAHVPPDARLALVDIGLAGWLLPNPILDLGGIASPERQAFLRRAARAGTPWPRSLRLWLDQQRPEYVVVYPRWFPLLEAEPARFPVLHRIPIEGNVTMSGDELVVYATPWTRNPQPGAP